jgi:glycosyltransferase involved in cell wall biosynthesis|tara:strand:+ start:658 stop:1713 length:1056 start_codon:yes stop_codon:yes gene_type:complete
MRLLIGGSSSKMFHLEEFSEMLKKHDVDTKLVLDIEYADGFPSRKISNWFTTNTKFKKLINEFKPDLILVDRQRHFGLEASKTNIPLVVHLRGNYWEEMVMARKTLYSSQAKKIAINKWDEIGEKCFKRADKILPICKHLENVVKNHYPEKSTEVMYQGINSENWFKGKGMTLKHPCVGLVQGAVILEKTQELLTLTNALEKMPETTFYWVGDGPYKDNILPTLEKYDNFKWLGALSYPEKIRDFLTEIDVYALLSGIDMSPLTLLEAQLMKKPVIATRVGGIPELMNDNENGFLIEKGDSKKLVECLQLILNEPIRAKKMGDSGRKFVMDNFSWDIIAKKFIKDIKDLVK